MLHKTKRLLDTARRHLPNIALGLALLSELLGSLTQPDRKPKPLADRKAAKPNKNHRLQ